MKKLRTLLGLVLISFSLSACGEEIKPEPEVKYEQVSDQHYLIFKTIDNPEYARMIVHKDDTWKSIEKFFPVVPNVQPGYKGVWVEPSNGFYQEDIFEVEVFPDYSILK